MSDKRKIEQLLAVLDMSEDEQHDWCARCPGCRMGNESLADLAFRLRDEVFREFGAIRGFHDGIYKVQEYLGEDAWATAFWGECIAKPIHWIVSALIARINNEMDTDKN